MGLREDAVDDFILMNHMKLERQRNELLDALVAILEIGKRDMSNPKYDGYFTYAREVVAKVTGNAAPRLVEGGCAMGITNRDLECLASWLRCYPVAGRESERKRLTEVVEEEIARIEQKVDRGFTVKQRKKEIRTAIADMCGDESLPPDKVIETLQEIAEDCENFEEEIRRVHCLHDWQLADGCQRTDICSLCGIKRRTPVVHP